MYTGKLRIPTNRFCFKCHHRVFHSDVKGYPYVCPHCDENMYRFETYTKREKSRYVNPIVNAMKDRNTYTYGTVRTAMEEEARKKNYILSWIYSEMIGAGVQHMETLKEKYQFISNRMNYAYRLPGNKNGSLFDEAEIHNILKGYGI